jgi:hypothetical protein
VIHQQPFFHDGDAVQYRADRKRGERNPEQVLAFADQREDGVQQAERVQGRGHAQPDDTHFSHAHAVAP